MQTFKTIMKIVAALAIIAGIVFVIAKYGERIAAWAKQLMNRCCEFFGIKSACCCCDTDGTILAEDIDFEG